MCCIVILVGATARSGNIDTGNGPNVSSRWDIGYCTLFKIASKLGERSRRFVFSWSFGILNER